MTVTWGGTRDERVELAGWGNLWPGEFNVEEILRKDNFLVNQKKEEGKSPTNLLVTFYWSRVLAA